MSVVAPLPLSKATAPVEALGLPITARIMCDTKPAAMRLLKEQECKATNNDMLSSTSCLFRKMEDVCDGKAVCLFHGKACSLPEERPGLVTLGAPCQPYSSMRSNKQALPAHRHHDFNLIFEGFMQYMDVHAPRAGTVEEIMGFAAQLPEGTDDDGNPLPASWLGKLLGDLEGRRYFTRVFRLDNNVWSELPRPRLSCRIPSRIVDSSMSYASCHQ